MPVLKPNLRLSQVIKRMSEKCEPLFDYPLYSTDLDIYKVSNIGRRLHIGNAQPLPYEGKYAALPLGPTIYRGLIIAIWIAYKYNVTAATVSLTIRDGLTGLGLHLHNSYNHVVNLFV